MTAVEIVKIEVGRNGDHLYKLNKDNLKKILLNKKIQGKPVAIVSVSGVYRKGKSFLLNFFIRYLKEVSGNEENVEEVNKNWLGDPSVKLQLKGFSFKGGSNPDTQGILLWSEPFIVKRKDGSEIVVLLMDTQGTFDSGMSMKDNSTVFALSTLLSSVQIYNLTNNIQENDLDYLHYFIQYGRLLLENESSEKPFQSLFFLIRDWSYPYEHSYGLDGGMKLLEKRLTPTSRQSNSQKEMRDMLKKCFEDMKCFLLPYPGEKVAQNPKFDGYCSDIYEEFLENLRCFVPLVLSPDNLMTKKLANKCITPEKVIDLFKTYVSGFQSGNIPEPTALFQIHAELTHKMALDNAVELYKTIMREVLDKGNSLPKEDFKSKHEATFKTSEEHFLEQKKFGGEEYSEEFQKQLKNICCDKLYPRYKTKNKLNGQGVFGKLASTFLQSKSKILMVCIVTGTAASVVAAPVAATAVLAGVALEKAVILGAGVGIPHGVGWALALVRKYKSYKQKKKDN